MSNLEWQAVGEPSAEAKLKELELIRLSNDESYIDAIHKTYEINKGKLVPILGNERLHIGEIIEYCKKKVAQLERFNMFVSWENSEFSRHLTKEYWGHRQVAEYLEELKQYRDLEEQGLLLRLPCKAGDTFWELNENTEPPYVYPRIAHRLQHCVYALERLGKTTFLTQSEAEEKLRELEGVKCQN